MRQHQALPLVKTAAADADQAGTRVHHSLQKTQLLVGLRKTYRAANEDDTTMFPEEYQKVQLMASNVLAAMLPAHERYFDLVASRDYTNMLAKANVVVDGKVLIEDAPVPFLLWLEEQVEILEKIVRKLPILPSDTTWTFNENEGAWQSPAVETTKGKKTQEVLVLYPHTDKHPAQTQLVDVDVLQGYWTTVKYAGALPQPVILAMLGKTRKLLDAIKIAVGEANSIEVLQPKPGKKILEYLFSEVL